MEREMGSSSFTAFLGKDSVEEVDKAEVRSVV